MKNIALIGCGWIAGKHLESIAPLQPEERGL